MLTIAAGGVFVFLSTLWPCAWYWYQQSQRRSCQFTPVLFYALILCLFYVGVAAALASQVYKHFDVVRDREHHGCDNLATMPFWVVSAMAVLLVFFVLCSGLVCLCCRTAYQR